MGLRGCGSDARHAWGVLALLAAVCAEPAAAQCPCEGGEEAPPPPRAEGWVEGTYQVDASGSDQLWIDATVFGHVTDRSGQIDWQGTHLRLRNQSECPFWFGRSGVINEAAMPGRRRMVFLSRHRSRDDAHNTEVEIYARYCDGDQVDDDDEEDEDEAPRNVFSCGAGGLCCVPGMRVGPGQCTCPPGSDRGPDPTNPSPLLSQCTCRNGTHFDRERGRCVDTGGCPAGMRFISSPAGGRCECPHGERWEPSTRTCIDDMCLGRSEWDPRQQRCACPDGLAWSRSRGRCFEPECTGGRRYDTLEERCFCPPSAPAWQDGRCTQCPPGAEYGGTRCECTDDTPHWNPEEDRCVACPGVQVWNDQIHACEDPPPCSPPCDDDETCVNDQCVHTGQLQITLTWDRPGDMDLHVLTPHDGHIYFNHRRADGGELDRDDTGGTGPENVFWESSPPSGRYVICATPWNIDGRTDFRVRVVRGTTVVDHFPGSRFSQDRSDCSVGSPNYVTTIHVP